MCVFVCVFCQVQSDDILLDHCTSGTPHRWRTHHLSHQLPAAPRSLRVTLLDPGLTHTTPTLLPTPLTTTTTTTSTTLTDWLITALYSLSSPCLCLISNTHSLTHSFFYLPLPLPLLLDTFHLPFPLTFSSIPVYYKPSFPFLPLSLLLVIVHYSIKIVKTTQAGLGCVVWGSQFWCWGCGVRWGGEWAWVGVGEPGSRWRCTHEEWSKVCPHVL